MQPLNHTHMFRSNIQLVMWNRFLRLLTVGRHLFFAAALGLVVLALLDARSRFQDYKRAKDLFSYLKSLENNE